MKGHSDEAKSSDDAAAGGGCPMGHGGGAGGAEGVPGDGGKGAPVYYHSYLQLDKILGAQRPLSATAENPEGEHDEMLFLIIHQTFELWFKQVLHEVSAVIAIFSKEYVEDTESARCLHHLGRVCAILRLAVSQFDVLETLTPVDFMSFRDALFPASGFQSVQFRVLENRLGMDPTKRIQYQNAPYHVALAPEHAAKVQAAEHEATLFGAIERWLERTPFVRLANFDFLAEYRAAVERMYDSDAALLARAFGADSPQYAAEHAKNRENRRDFLALFDAEQHAALQAKGLKTLSFRATQAALLITLYAEQPQLHVPYQLLQRLVDIDGLLAQWRHRHALVVQRTIGSKLGTGGSSGYGYLRAVIEPTRVFRDISNLATYVIRPGAVPRLPPDVEYQLGSVFGKSKESNAA